MLEIFGKNYYIDIDGITNKCRTNTRIKDLTLKNEDEIDEDEDEGSIEVNIFKYEIIKMCLDRVLNDFEEVDEEMGVFGANETSTSFKMAFNTLIKTEIIKEDDE